MLAAINRLTSREDFARTTKSSIKSSTESLVGYLVKSSELSAPKVGFIVSRALGGAVSRHHITRQLRHATRTSLHLLPQESLVVVRAKKKPEAANEIPILFSALSEKSKKASVVAS